MKIDLFAFCYNDAQYVPFFLDYYKPIVDTITFIDSGSDDGTLKLIKDYKVIHTGLKTWDWDAGHVILQNVWKDSDADYVFFPNMDEIFYHPNMRRFLERCLGRFDVFKMRGFQMVADGFPRQGDSLLTLKMGVPYKLYDKPMIFNPKVGITFVNAHEMTTTSKKVDNGSILLLHYKFLGVEEQLRRARLVLKRVPKDSFCKGIGGNILKVFPGLVKTRQEYAKEILDLKRQAKRII